MKPFFQGSHEINYSLTDLATKNSSANSSGLLKVPDVAVRLVTIERDLLSSGSALPEITGRTEWSQPWSVSSDCCDRLSSYFTTREPNHRLHFLKVATQVIIRSLDSQCSDAVAGRQC